jgi:hypothetical protein
MENAGNMCKENEKWQNLWKNSYILAARKKKYIYKQGKQEWSHMDSVKKKQKMKEMEKIMKEWDDLLSLGLFNSPTWSEMHFTRHSYHLLLWSAVHYMQVGVYALGFHLTSSILIMCIFCFHILYDDGWDYGFVHSLDLSIFLVNGLMVKK